MNDRILLVAGASGLVGHAAVEHFAARPGWRVVTLARRALDVPEGVRHVRADLADAASCRAAAAELHGVTHVLYAALFEQPDLLAGWTDDAQIRVNETMLGNLLDVLGDDRGTLRHVTLLQGTKAYGSHVGRVPVPAKERWPRMAHKIFYWQQEDLLRRRQAAAGWRHTILRPQIILGHAVGSPMNIVAALGVYAAVMRELGRPLAFPGGGRYVNACSDARLIAEAVEFAGTTEAAAGEAYNIVNGDVLTWHDVWPSIAAHFGMAAAEPEPLRLAEAMPAHARVWARLAARHGLRQPDMAALVGSSWQFADRNFAWGQDDPDDRVVSPVKLRQAGFAGCRDTEDALLHWLDRLRAGRWLPP